MGKGSALRFASVDVLPPTLRAAYEAQYGVAAPRAAAREPTAKRSKYGATAVHVDGIRFDSKREARVYERLKRLRELGEVDRFHRQVVFDLPGGVIYRLDFLVIFADGRIGHWDAKGVETKEFKIKRRLVRATYGVEIESV